MRNKFHAVVALVGLSGSIFATGQLLAADSNAVAVSESDSYGNNDIVVTARKRDESVLNVPVVISAVSGVEMERMGISDIKAVQTMVPGMTIGQGLLATGTQVSIRGVGTASLDPGIDQSVSFNIDGLQLSQGLAFSSGTFDVSQIEVLKGPQALFYGKSSPGGVISLRTNDPGDQFELIARGGYEFEANEGRGELVVSGPATDTLGLRVAGYYSAARGFFRNEAKAIPGYGALDPQYSHISRSRSYAVRGTVVWNPSSNFDARLKLNLVRDRTMNPDASQLVSCPDGVGAPAGVPYLSPDEDCRFDRVLRSVRLDPRAFPEAPNGGQPFLQTNQKFGTLELNFHPSSDLTLTSTTAYYRLRSHSLVANGNPSGAAPPTAAEHKFRRDDFTQELRLSSDFQSPVNFLVGLFYQDGEFANRIRFNGNTALGYAPVRQFAVVEVDTKAYSAFGQLLVNPTPELELAGGVRWTDETREANAFNLMTSQAIGVKNPSIGGSNFAPELTISYRPNTDLTFFGALKRGYKSGSYSVASATIPSGQTALDNSFGDEKVEGGELGIKSRVFDRQLNLNIAAYLYDYEGLQVGATAPPVNGINSVKTVNAGGARVRGVEFDASFHPHAVPGLGIRASANWNRTRFIDLDNVPCYGGQTVGAGCDQMLNETTGRYTAQNLSGTQMLRAPTWQGNFGFDYRWELADGKNIILANNNQFSSKYRTVLSLRDDVIQSGFVKTDWSMALEGAKRKWEVALIGRNLSNRITAGTCANSNYANGSNGGQITGELTNTGNAGVDEIACYSDRGRSVRLQLTLRPFG